MWTFSPFEKSRLPVPDLISKVVGDTRRIENFSSKALSAAALDPQVKFQWVSISRFYLFARPPVMIDFEPAPHVTKMYVEAKRRWCHAQGYVYVPIFLREKLTEQQLRDRIDEEMKALEEATTVKNEDAALKRGRKASKVATPTGWTISDAEVQDLIDQETLARVTAEIRGGYSLRGVAKQRRIEAVRREVEAEFLQRIRDGRVGSQLRYRQSALAARGQHPG